MKGSKYLVTLKNYFSWQILTTFDLYPLWKSSKISKFITPFFTQKAVYFSIECLFLGVVGPVTHQAVHTAC